MKQKSNSLQHLHLDFLFTMAQMVPTHLSKRKNKEFLDSSKKLQARLGRTKRIMCLKCHSILIPKVNCEANMEKRDCGFGLHTKCLVCGESRFMTQRKVSIK